MTRAGTDDRGFAKPPVVSVNGTTIARDAIARETQHHPAAKPYAAWQAAARALVVRELLLQEARRLGLAAAPASDDQGRRESEEEALVRALIEREVATPEPDEAACRRYYMQNQARFRAPALYAAAHILLKAPAQDIKAFTLARRDAEAIIADLRAHPERFAALARLHSACPSAAQGGELGEITAADVTPEFARALDALAPGALSEKPVATRYGLHVIRLDRKVEGKVLPFEHVGPRIADYLRESVARRATAQYIARLVSRATITGLVLDGVEAHRVSA